MIFSSRRRIIGEAPGGCAGRLLLLAGVMLWPLHTSVDAAPVAFQLPTEAGEPRGSITLIVPEDGVVAFPLIRQPVGEAAPGKDKPLPEGEKAKTIQVELLLDVPDSKAEAEHTADIQFAAADGQKGAGISQSKEIDLADSSFTVSLFARDMEPGSTCSRRLTLFSRSADVERGSWTVNLIRARPPTPVLALAPQAITQNVVSWFPLARAGTTISGTLREETGWVPVDGVRIWLDGETKSPEGSFRFKKNDEFLLNGRPVDLFHSRGDQEGEGGPVSLEAGEQAEMSMKLTRLSAGEHKFTVKAGAAGGKAAEAPSLTVTLNVKHHWAVALVALIIATGASYVTTKGVKNILTRRQLHARTVGLRHDWLRDLPATSAVISVRAWLRQSLDVIVARGPRQRKGGWAIIGRITGWSYLVPAPNRIRQRLDRSERLVKLLDEYRRLSRELADRSLPRMLRYRIGWELDDFLKNLGTDVNTEEDYQRLLAGLLPLKEWISDREGHYWKLLRKQADLLLDKFDPQQLWTTDAASRQEVLNQLADIERPDRPGNLADIIEFDNKYAQLRVLWENRDNEDIRAKLLDRVVQGDTWAALEIADTALWDRVMGMVAAPDGSVKLVPNDSERPPAPIQAFGPIRFSIKFRDRKVSESHVINSAVECLWRFVLEPNNGDKIQWTQDTIGPEVVQYAPQEGKLTIEATLTYGDKTTQVGPVELTIAPASEYSAHTSFRRAELVTLGAAGLIAIVSGLKMFYFDNATFGSPGDYLSLFLWAVGVDQGKNLTEIMRTDEG